MPKCSCCGTKGFKKKLCCKNHICAKNICHTTVHSHLERKYPHWKTEPLPLSVQLKLLAYISLLEATVRGNIGYIFNSEYFSDDEVSILLHHRTGDTTVGEELERRFRAHKFQVCVKSLSAWMHELYATSEW